MRIVFIGTGAIGVPALRMLSEKHELVGVVTQPDKPAGRNQRMSSSPVKNALAENAIPILQPARIRDEEAITWVRELAPEVIIVMAFGQILPRALLDVPRFGCLNLHASLLPRWRGAAPIQAAITAGDGGTGITVMYMDEGLDTGDILLQRRIEIAPDETGGSLHDRLAQIAPGTLDDALALLAKNNAPRIAQENSRATYAPKMERKDGSIDWNERAAAIERKIRAYNPWPGAFTTICDKKRGRERTLKIFRARVVEKNEGGFVFRTGDGLVELLEVQLEGARKMSAEEFLRGHPGITMAREPSG
jgi:methionyl-tRNA formyltransferase